MARASHRGGSRSLALYALLLKLYPTEFRRQHCAEMLQNFEDLERAASSRSALWTRILASALGETLLVRERAELGPAFGAARLARLATTNEAVEDVCSAPRIISRVEPEAARPAIPLFTSSGDFCWACSPCTSRRAFTGRDKMAPTCKARAGRRF